MNRTFVKTLVLALGAAGLCAFPGMVRGQWIAFNDHQIGTGTGPNVTTISVPAAGAAGGPLVNNATGQQLPAGMRVVVDGSVNGNVTGSSSAPTPGTPADQIFAGKIDWLASAILLGPAGSYDSAVTYTFTNLTPGVKYRFRGTAVRGNGYGGRWTIATITGVNSAMPAHITGTGTPGIVTNGWAPYGNSLVPGRQAAWNSGHNLGGDVIGWDEIVPSGTSFSVINSNYHTLGITTVPAAGGGSTGVEDTYCYAMCALMLEEYNPVPTPAQITEHPTNVTVAEFGSATFRVSALGNPVPTYQWYTNGVLATDATNTLYTIASAPFTLNNMTVFAVASNFVTNVSYSATSSVAQLTVVPDTVPPTVYPLNPPAGATIARLNEVEVLFSEPVQGVDAADLLVNNVAATGLRFGGQPGQYVFEFTQPSNGPVQVAFATNHGITDVAFNTNAFRGSNWTYTLDPNAAPVGFVINEFLAANDNGLRDEDGDTSDWIEILNAASAQANLLNWSLTDDVLDLRKWIFPYYIVGANGYLVVFASGKDRTNTTPGAKLHTSFQLRKEGGYLALVDPQTNVVSVFNPYPAQRDDVSYGRDRLTPSIVGFFTTPTPGTTNVSSGAGFAPEVEYSRDSGTFLTNQPWNLVLSTPNSNAVIYYAFGTNTPTFAGSVFNGNNAAGSNSFRYTNSSPIRVTNSLIIRARAFVTNLFPGPISSKVYIALANQTNITAFNSDLPIVVLHNYGQGTVPSSKAEQYVVMQVFDTGCGRSSMTNQPDLTARGVFHVRGSSTAVPSTSKAAFFLETRDEFGQDKAVEFLGLPEESDWVLYAPNNFEPALFHNPLAFQLARDMGQYASRHRFFELYLKDDSGNPREITSAEYMGIYVLEEKIKRDDNRVNIARLDVEDVAQPAVTGGYMLSIDRASPGEPTLSAGGATLNWIEPNGDDMTNTLRQPQITYIQGYLNNFNTVLQSANYTNVTNGYVAWIDVDSWVTRHVHEVITFNVDALRLSGFFFKDRNKKIEYGPAWDYDRTQGSTDGRDANPRTWRSQTGDLGTDFFNFSPWWNRLFTAADFWQAWIDKYQASRDGALSLSNVYYHIDRFYNELREAQPREQARWNITPRGTNGTGSGTYVTEITWKKNWYAGRLNFADTNFLDRPTLSSPGGAVASGFQVTLTPAAKAGSFVVYTLDGTDPRLPGGAVAPGALSNSAPVTITVTTNIRVFARSWNAAHRNLTGANNPPISSPWSGPRVGTFYTSLPPLRITEIMYHPTSEGTGTNDADNFEYLELKNIGATPLNLNRFRLRGGIEFDFPNLVLAAGSNVLVVKDRALFASRYNTNGLIIAGVFSNNLANDGDHLVLEGPVREPILDFNYDDDWYPITDGPGFSLVLIDPTQAVFTTVDGTNFCTWGLKESWRPSGAFNGSPGMMEGTPPTLPTIYVSEALTHTDPSPGDAIELCNPTGGDVDLGGWFLTDSFGNPKKYRIPAGTTIAAGGYLVFYQSNSFGVGSNGFALNARGDDVYLFSGDANTNLTGWVHGFDFGAQANGATFGRYLISSGDDHFVTQISPTLGAANAGPLVGPVVLSEIMYHPPDLLCGPHFVNDDDDEFVELYNNSASEALLYDPANPTNTWKLRDAVDYVFPMNTTIPPGGYLVVVGFPPTNTVQLDAFRAKYNMSSNVPIYGPWEGNLNNAGDRVELARPDLPQPPGTPDAGFVPYILAERVKYSDTTPWPGAADGLGPSLQRVNANTYGNDHTNWVAAGPSPGQPYVGGNPPVVVSHPASQTVVEGNPVTFTVGLTGTGPFTYQWRLNGTNIPGAFGSNYAIASVSATNQGLYSVVVLGAAGSVISSNAALTVLLLPRLTTQPMSTNVQAGSNVTLSVVVSGNPPIRYQWRHDGTNLPGATNSTLTLSNVQIRVDDGVYVVEVTDAVATVLSSNAVVTVLARPVITQQPVPATQTIAEGSTLVISVSVSNNATLPISYRWRRGGATYTNAMLNAYTHVLTIPNCQSNLHAGTWTVAITNVAGAAPLSSNAVVNILRPPVITLHPTNQVVDPGSNVAFFAAATGQAPLGYQWYFNGTNALPDATNTSLSLSNVDLSHDGGYTFVASNQVGLATSQVGYLTVRVPLAVTAQPSNQTATVCSSNVSFTVGVSGGGPPRYQWYFNGTNVLTGATNATLVIASPTLADAGAYHAVVSNVVNVVTSDVATLTFTLGDSDDDGMPDTWELAHGLDPCDPADRDEDADHDGLSNHREYVSGSDPQDPLSVLRVRLVDNGAGGAVIQFTAMPGVGYTIQYATNNPAGPWWNLHQVAAQAGTNEVSYTHTQAGTLRDVFYRIATPPQAD